MKKFTGLIPPMVTPLSAPDRLDVASTKKMVRHLVDGGVDGIFLLGADGGVCTGANLWPATFKAMYEAAKRGDVDEVRRLQEITTTSSYLLYGLGAGQIGFLKGVKAALAEMGLVRNVLTPPFTPFKGAELKPVRAAIRKLRQMGAR